MIRKEWRIVKTSFPSKYTKKGSQRYIAVPASVEERMGLKDGDYLDVVIEWPIIEEVTIDNINGKEESKDSGSNSNE